MTLDRNLRFVVFRYSHHSPHSGYSRTAEYGAKLFDSETIRAEKPLSRKVIRERMLWKISAGTPGYDRTSMAVELKTMRRMLSEHDSIFHFLYGETTYHYAGLLNHKRNNHVVATFHLPPAGIREAIHIDWHIKKLSAVVCVGRNQQEFFEKIIGSDRVFFAPLGVASDYFIPPLTIETRDPDLCLIVGENYRDYPTLRGVIELVAYLRPRTKFVILTPPKNSKLLGEHPNLAYTSGISEAELLNLYQSASVLLMPLHDATANNAILEGMSCGLPIVVTDVGAVRDYVDPACGRLIAPYQARAMAEAVIDVLNDESARSKMSSKCRQHALQFSWEESVGKLRIGLRGVGLKTISIIIPNYNNAHYLGCAIQSVLDQTFTDYEIIVVDDGSTDNSKDVVSVFGDKVRYIWQENMGLGGARNTGILASNAEFVGLLDADDEWMPTYLEKMFALIQNFPDAVVYYSSARGMDSHGKNIPVVFGRKDSSQDVYQRLLRANFIIPSTVIMRRSIIVTMGLFEQNNREIHGCEDWDLWLRLSPHYQIVGTSESLVRYRLHENTFSANSNHMQRAVRAVIEKNFGVEDKRYEDWSSQRRRAFGGVYRYYVLTSVKKQQDWMAGSRYLSKAFEVDPTLAVDLDLFYELVSGVQLPNRHLKQTVADIMKMLADVFHITENRNIHGLRSKAYGTANYAIGLVAYNTRQRALSRRHLLKALYFRPELWRDQLVTSNIIKSFLDNPLTIILKKFVSAMSLRAG